MFICLSLWLWDDLDQGLQVRVHDEMSMENGRLAVTRNVGGISLLV